MPVGPTRRFARYAGSVSQPDDPPDAESPAPPPLPTSLVPRWLAALVLAALLAAGLLSAWLVLGAEPGESLVGPGGPGASAER